MLFRWREIESIHLTNISAASESQRDVILTHICTIWRHDKNTLMLLMSSLIHCCPSACLWSGVVRHWLFSLCCAVALNFQTPGEQMDLNQGRFLPNGRCGYTLKPGFLCSTTSDFNPEITGGGPGHIPTQLTIRVSGDPYGIIEHFNGFKKLGNPLEFWGYAKMIHL